MTNQQKPEALRPEMLDDLIETFATAALGRHNLMRVELPRRQWAQLAVALSRLHAENDRPAALVEAQQPAPAAAAVDEGFLRSVITLCNNRGASPESIENFDSDDRWIADLWRQAEHLIATTPQADSQPAPVRDYPPLPEPDLGMPWRVNAKSDGAAHSSGFTCEQMRAYVDADRADRAPAESVLEDAARYRWLRDCNLAKFPEINTAFYLGNKNLDTAIDAARKEGGAA